MGRASGLKHAQLGRFRRRCCLRANAWRPPSPKNSCRSTRKAWKFKEIPMKFHLISPNSGGDKSLSDASELEGEVMERAISGQLGAVCASPPSQPLAPAEQILDDFPALEDAVAEAALTP